MKRALIYTTIGLTAGSLFAAGPLKHFVEHMTDQATKEGDPTGYTNTPMLPNSQWRVHDDARPRPEAVTPGAEIGAPPSDAVVLFSGKDLEQFHGKNNQPAGWKVENGHVEVKEKAGDIWTKESFGDCQIHFEFMAPNPPEGHSQGRGNSGIFIMDRYEVQVLDCFENKTYADGMTGSIYGQTPPLKNACRKPGEWQTYDIIFDAPRFKDGKVEKPAYLTVFLNGVVVQNHTELIGSTSHKAVGTYSEHPPKLPMRFQDHGDPVRYRNIWVRHL